MSDWQNNQGDENDERREEPPGQEIDDNVDESKAQESTPEEGDASSSTSGDAPAWSTSSWTSWQPGTPPSSTGGWTPPTGEQPQSAAPDQPEPSEWGAPPPAPTQPPVTWGSQQQPPPATPSAESTPSWGAAAPPPPPPQSPPPPSSGAYGSGSFQPPSANASKRTFQLGPLTVADILDTTFQLMKANWKQLGIAVLVYAIPAGIVSAIINLASESNAFRLNSGGLGLFTGYTDTSDDLSEGRAAIVLLGTLLLLGFSVVLQPYVQGAVTRLVASSYLGRDMTAHEALRGVLKLWPAFIGATILVALCIMCGLIALLIGAVVVWVLFTAVVPIIAIEEEGAFNALGRSWALMKKRFWSYLGARVLITIITLIVSFAVVLVPTILEAVLDHLGADAVGWLVYTAGVVAAEIIVFPISAIACTLIYFDSRVRNEGFDVQFMAARLPSTGATQQPQQPPYNV